MNKLIIFTKLFPYGKTEAFLESEIEVLSKHFNKIVVCPAYTDKFLRKLPGNVIIDSTYTIDKKKRVKSSIKSLITGKYFVYVLDHMRNLKSINDITNLLRYSSYEIYYEDVYKKSNFNFNDCVVYSYWFSYIVNSFVKLRSKYNLKCKIVTRAHRWDIYEEKSSIFPYRQQIIDGLDAIYSISEDGKEYLENRYGNNSKIFVSRLGIFDQGLINQPSKTREIHFISVSQITARKRVVLIYDALNAYAEENNSLKIKWTHFGTGDLLSTLEGKIRNNSNSNFEIVLKGYVLNSDIYKFYQSENIDFFINVSESEGVPVSIMEAQSFGIPVIATNVGGTSEIVNNEVGELLSANPGVKDICKAIDRLYHNQIDREVIKLKWQEKSDAQKNYNKFAELLFSL